MRKYLMMMGVVLLLVAFNNKKDRLEVQCNPQSESVFKLVKMENSNFQISLPEGNTKLYRLKNKAGLEMEVTNFGARVISLFVPDREGHFEDIVLGYDSVRDYISTPNTYFGAPVGRYANRIANAQFTLGDKIFRLEANNNPNNIHGGPDGFHKVVWKVEEEDEQHITFSYFSKDGQSGFPGNLTVKMTYSLTDENEFRIDYTAETDKPTVVNLSHHSYFNLNGAGNGDINNHTLYINADHYTPVNELLIPTGKISSVKETPLDFTTPHIIGDRIDNNFEQLKIAGGYDHNWVLNKEGQNSISLAAKVWAPNGRKMEVYTSQPGMQFYSGNFLNDVKGKRNQIYTKRGGFCLETQHFPDSPNQPDFPSVVLRPGETYLETCIYKFSVKK